MAAAPENIEPDDMNAEEFRELIERRIRRRFRMSLEAFAKAFEAGEFTDDPSATEFALLTGARPGTE